MTVAPSISAVFLALSVFLLLLTHFNELNALVYYGKVAQGRTPKDSSFMARLINALAKVTVPKSRFAHFYVLYLTLMWAQMVFLSDLILRDGKYLLVWLFCTFHATRRLYESYHVTKFSKTSTMHVSHYLLGLIFYLGVATTCFYGLQNQYVPVHNDSGTIFTPLTGFLVVLFTIVQIDQFRNHKHLAGLVKYSVPSRGLFSVASSAHYFDEIMVYFTVTLLVFTMGEIIAEDWSLLCIWIFVVTNLSISALETHAYYQDKFDHFSVKYAVIPGVI